MIEIGVIGSGAMGSGIAQVAATAGHSVVLFDTNENALAKAKQSYDKVFKSLVEKGKLSQEKSDAILSRISFAKDLSALANCKLTIEAIIENIEIKKDVFQKIEAIVSEDAIIASNTSSLSITSLASSCKKPERFVGIHFFNPAPLMPLVEIIPGIQSDCGTVAKAKELIDSWGKKTVLAKDTPGFIVNRVARPYYGESIRILEEGIADISTIDWALRELGGFRMGPFELMDMIGNDINYKVTESVWEQFFYDPRFKPSFTQRRLFEAGRFGRKTGQGYYSYAEGVEKPEPNKSEVLGKAILDRVLAMLINEAYDALHLGIATAADIDTAMTSGVNYPKGLIQLGQEIGLGNVLITIDSLYNDYREDRYRASVKIRREA